MKKHLANIITGSRIAFSLSLMLTFVEVTYSTSAICVLATIAVAQEVYLAKKGREVV